MRSARLKGLAPSADRRARILILGSFPGPMSLARREYYAHPRNQFWRLIFELLGEPAPRLYRQKLAVLRKNRVALWDAVGSCRRENAADGTIKDHAFNDIPGLLKKCRGVKAVFCNGNKSYSLCLARYGGLGIPIVYLPSTSPANAGHSYEYKKMRWKKILKARD